MNYKRREHKIFQFVCNQILNRECIPFIGSGISNDCVYTGDNVDFRDRKGHTVKGLIIALTTSEPDCGQLGQKCEEFLWLQNKESEKEALQKLVDKLQIKEFVWLAPTVAHKYIAFLVREGLVNQIITTNYDCAMEWAFLETFRSDIKINLETYETIKDEYYKQISIIHDQESCGQQHFGKQGSGNHLHIYKINGCAMKLSEGLANYHNKILLTMKQLQSWRERRWAKDQFRVVLRSNTVLFSGFGSDEPQVIHTVHQILDELSTYSPTKPFSFEGDGFPSNAPVIHSFEPNANIQFQHKQIVNNYVQSVNGKFDDDIANDLILTKEKLEEKSENTYLKADEFWGWVFQEIQHKLITYVIDKAISGELSIGLIPFCRYLFDEIKSKWVIQKNEKPTSLHHLLEISVDETYFSNLFTFTFGNSKSYIPIRNNESIVSEFIFYYYIAHLIGDVDVSKVKSENQNFLFFQNKSAKYFYISSNMQNSEYVKVEFDSLGNPIFPVFLLSRFSNVVTSAEMRTCRLRIENESTRSRTHQMLLFFTISDIAYLIRTYMPLSRNSNASIGFSYSQFISEICNAPLKWHSKLYVGRQRRIAMRKIQ